MKPLSELLDASSTLHRHLCPRQVLGVRMGMWAGELLGLDLPQTDKRLLTIVETDGCFADGVAVATNCWVGRRTLRVEDYGKVAATFVDTCTGQALRIAPQLQARHVARDYAPEASDKWEAMLLGYQYMEITQLFTVQSVALAMPVAALISHPGHRVVCEQCGEEIINERELVLGQRIVCQACAGQTYYHPRALPPNGDKRTSWNDEADRTPKIRDNALAVADDLLEASVAQRTRELLAAFEVSHEIVAQLDLDHVLESVTERAQALLQARASWLCLLAPDGETLELAASRGWSGVKPGMRQSAHRGLAVPVVREGQMMMAQTPCATCAVLCQYGPGQCAIAPLRAGETTLGALCVVRDHDKSFDPEQTRSLALLANAAAIAIANARLAATARQEAARSASCAERERLAAELHDHLAQTLSFLNLKADRLQELLAAGFTAESAHELARMKAAIATAYNQVRAALAGLQQPTAVADDLAEKLTACLAEFRTTAGLAADLLVTDPTALALPPVTQIQVLHIVREALTNVRRHAQAQHVCVRIERIDDTACFTVEDDGRGFDPQAIVGDHHLGLAIMRTRAERSGGHFALVSAPGAGTKIVVHLPCGAQSKTA